MGCPGPKRGWDKDLKYLLEFFTCQVFNVLRVHINTLSNRHMTPPLASDSRLHPHSKKEDVGGPSTSGTGSQ